MPKLRKEEETSPRVQKLIILLFGLGPIIIMGWFLATNGFFD